MNENQDLKQKFSSSVEKLSNTLLKYPWGDTHYYAFWLSQTYHLVKHTTRLLCLAAAQTPLDSRDLHYSFIKHLKEEVHHDLPIVKDLESLGYKVEDFEELPVTQMIINNQYYWLQRGSVYALNSYALLLEGLSVKCIPLMLKQIADAGNESATRFLKLHYESDLSHYPDGLNSLCMSPKLFHEEISQNLKQSCVLYELMYSSILNQNITSTTAPPKTWLKVF